MLHSSSLVLCRLRTERIAPFEGYDLFLCYISFFLSAVGSGDIFSRRSKGTQFHASSGKSAFLYLGRRRLSGRDAGLDPHELPFWTAPSLPAE
jgi:hypothetical protein